MWQQIQNEDEWQQTTKDKDNQTTTLVMIGSEIQTMTTSFTFSFREMLTCVLRAMLRRQMSKYFMGTCAFNF
jgi:hypothetical protein